MAKKPRKKPPVNAQWVQATIPPGEAASSRWRSSTALSELVNRAVQWVDIGASLRARSCTAVRLRMYEPAASSRSKRVTAKSRLAFLRHPANGKAAEYADDARELAEITEHPALDIIRRPSLHWLGFEHVFMRHWDRLITGNAFEQVLTPENPQGLYRLAPNKTRIVTSATEFVSGYVYGERGAQPTTFDVEEVNHYRFRPSPFSPVLGIGPLQAILLDVDRHSASTQHDLNMWRNSGRPDGMIKLPDGAGEKQVEQVKTEWARQYGGPRNAGKVLVATGIEFTPFSWTPKDLEGIASREDARTLILAAFGVPESMAKMNDANLASSWTGNVQYRRETVWPDLVQDQTALNEFLLPRFGIAPGEAWLAYDNPVPDDDKATLERSKSMVSLGAKTINEWRAEEGMDPSDEEGADQLRFQGVPLDALSAMGPQSINATDGVTMGPKLPEGERTDNPALPAGSVPPAPGGAVVQDTALNGAQMAEVRETVAAIARGEIPAEAGRIALQISLPTVPPDKIAELIGALDGFEPKPPEPPPAAPGTPPATEEDEDDDTKSAKPLAPASDTALILAKGKCHGACCTSTQTKDDRSERAAERALERAMRGFMENAAAAFFAQADPVTGGVPLNEWRRIFDEHVQEPILETFGAGFNGGAAEVEAARPGTAAAVRFDVATERAQQALSAYTIRLRESVVRTMTDRLIAAAVSPIDDPAFVAPTELNTALRAAIEKGDSLAGAIGRVREEFDELSGYGAERIARTETQRAYGSGRIAAWQDIPGVTHKEWLLSGNPCAMCLDLYAKRRVVRLDEPFARIGETYGGVLITYADVNTNTLHPNDSCGMTFVFEDEQETAG